MTYFYPKNEFTTLNVFEIETYNILNTNTHILPTDILYFIVLTINFHKILVLLRG